ncbi:hypothetical protein TPHA_0A01830 [Tetrapisispora phaffii CBS 4417]|uniref:Actin-like protein ARP6 n=1 Tax=Tetrapisispora phaffii (strain ATCC 24235 / CBS 4417 / NBRC 1672 / NRRL Y-8282 / UCD 70-5) TaxID=1071381 RepID=G8BMY8_TETPH|nr:hypothetical protein TPHA_0A01830 [Tetrapisispora phaffii CBS 4417]CCE61266.1 hypothetical protein TPHA_0A01830 [Tetrapisispora phaffii CBS 4417]
MGEAPLLIDNGSYEIKFGYSNQETPFVALNALAKDKYETYYLSNQINNIKDISSVSIKRPHQLGQLVSWELEHEIWDYCFYNGDDFKGFEVNEDSENHLVLTETPMTLPELSRNTDQVVFEEYGFDSLYKAPAANFIPFIKNDDNSFIRLSGKSKTYLDGSKENNYQDFNLVIDSGYNCSWIIPMIKGVPYYKAVKKMDMGGRFLNGLLKETISYRHYDVTDESMLVNNIKENCMFISPVSYIESFKKKALTKVEYVLPDFQTSFMGYVRDMKKHSTLPEHSQSIILEDELFSVPEGFFHPEMANVLKPGIIETILESLFILPESLRSLMVNNIVCTGGNFNIPNFGSRIYTELQKQVQTEWVCDVSIPKANAELQNWKAMKSFTENNEELYKHTRVTKQEYNEHGFEWTTKQRFGYQNWL